VSSSAHLSPMHYVCDVVRCSVLQCVAVRCSVLQCVAVGYSVLQCVAVCCSVLQRVAACCSVLQCVSVSSYVSSWDARRGGQETCQERHGVATVSWID